MYVGIPHSSKEVRCYKVHVTHLIIIKLFFLIQELLNQLLAIFKGQLSVTYYNIYKQFKQTVNLENLN